jgi:hypothetical protein
MHTADRQPYSSDDPIQFRSNRQRYSGRRVRINFLATQLYVREFSFPEKERRWAYVQAYLNPNLRQRASFHRDLCTKTGVCDFIWPPYFFSLRVFREYRMDHSNYGRYTLKMNFQV